jgi:hypothetical protein
VDAYCTFCYAKLLSECAQVRAVTEACSCIEPNLKTCFIFRVPVLTSAVRTEIQTVSLGLLHFVLVIIRNKSDHKKQCERKLFLICTNISSVCYVQADPGDRAV